MEKHVKLVLKNVFVKRAHLYSSTKKKKQDAVKLFYHKQDSKV